MYTFKLPQQQQQQQQEPSSVGINVEAGVYYGVNADVDMTAYTRSDMSSGNAYESSYGHTTDTAPTHTSLLQLQQQQQQHGEEEGEVYQAETEQQQQQQQQHVSDGQLADEASAEEILQYCRAMILRSHIAPPSHWRRLRRELPASIAELHLTPSAPETVQLTPSPCVVLILDTGVPDGMSTKEYAKSLVQYVVDLLAYKLAATAITSLRFVKIGRELSQLVVTFGCDVGLASLVLEEFTRVGLYAGFGTPMPDPNHNLNHQNYAQEGEYDAPCATFQVTDYRLTMHNGTGITAEDITALLLPTRAPHDISVVEGYEQGVFYVAVCRSETVHAWLRNPFCSFLVQRTLFERCGVLITMADCPHSFLSRGSGGAARVRKGAPYAVQSMHPTGRGHPPNYEGSTAGYDPNADDSGFEDENVDVTVDGRYGGDGNFVKKRELDANANYNNNNDDDDSSGIGSYNPNNTNDGDVFGSRGGDVSTAGKGDRTAKRTALAWARNAKEEVDIFDGLDDSNNYNKRGERSNNSLEFVDDDITKFLPYMNKEKQEDQQVHVQPQLKELGMRGGVETHFVSPIHQSTVNAAGMPTMQMPLAPFAFPLQQQQQQQSYGYHFPVGGGDWQPQPTVPMGDPHPMMTAPLGYNTEMVHMYEPVKEQKVKYPELVDDDESNNNNNNNNSNNNSNSAAAKQAGDEGFISQGREMQHDQLQGSQQALYWNRMGGQVVGNSGLGFYPMNTISVYGSHPYTPSMQQPQQYPYQQQIFTPPVNTMPSILGQPKYSTSFYTVDDDTGGGNLSNMHTNSGDTRVLPPPVLLSTPPAPLPTSLPPTQPPVITVEDAYELAEKLIELTQLVFSSPGEIDKSKPDETSQAIAETERAAVRITPVGEDATLGLLFNHVPCTAAVPPAAGEIEELMTFLEEQYVGIKFVINSTYPEMQESRHHIIAALLTCHSDTDNSEEMDWLQKEKGTDAEGVRYHQLPALLPYLLTSVHGTEIVSTLAAQEPLLLLPLLTRYVLPFLLDAAFVQTVCVVALRAVPAASNPLVQRLIRHWGPLTTWLHAHIQSQGAAAAAHAEIETSTHTSSSAQSLKSTTKTAVIRRLTSQVGNTIDILLTALSDEQRDSIRDYLDSTDALVNFMNLLQTPEDEKEKGEHEKGDGDRESIEVSDKITPSFLWGTEGAVHRSLLRLYLNANLFSGTVVVNTLFVPQASLTRDYYYFVLVAFSKSHVSPVLSKETARVCGTFLRLMEQKLLSVESDSNNTARTDSGNTLPPVLTEKDAVHLMDAALRALDSLEVYTCLRDAYFATPTPAKRYTQVEARLSQPTPPVTTQQQKHHYHHGNANKQEKDDEGHSSAAPVLPTITMGSGIGSGGWNAEWTVAMRNYPLVGEPFTPLPTGWTSALSRSYGHYYFKNAKGTATYRHPTDATEFMATPQAFLREPGVTTTLDEVIAQANSTLAYSTTSSEKSMPMTKELAEKWLQDQRMRVEPLDMAALLLLKIKYRVGGATGRRSYHETGGGSSSDNYNYGGRSYRHRRDSSEDNTHYHHHHHHPLHHYHHQQHYQPYGSNSDIHNTNNSSSSRKRERGTSFNPADIQRRLTAIHRAYPPRGHPFPALPRGWTCNLSSSSGLYYFRPPRGGPVYKHPLTRREYRAAPQAFVLHRGVKPNAVAVAAHCEVQKVEEWLQDQRQRDTHLDIVVVRMIPIDYASSSDCDGADDVGGDLEYDGENSGTREGCPSGNREGDPQHSHQPQWEQGQEQEEEQQVDEQGEEDAAAREAKNEEMQEN